MKTLKTEIKEIEKTCSQAIGKSTTLDVLEKVRVSFLGRKGKIAQLMLQLKKLSVEEKREIGPLLNTLKKETDFLYWQKREQLFDIALEKKEEQFKNFDVTAYQPNEPVGKLHPYTQATQLIQDIFIAMGYTIVDTPEVETEFYNFESLNIPENHPARDLQDTFFLNVPEMVMRTHTTPMQVRTMKKEKPPFAVLNIGRTYRHEATDASHDFMFQQIDGLLIGKDISLSNLIATMKTFLQKFFEKKDLKVRARPGYFPFVEPALEIDMSCPFCTNGCSTCSHSTWVEVVGSGLVHPHVLKYGGIDSKKFSGFAFGFGLTRLVMIKYGISDIRLLHSADVTFLNQF